MDRVILDLPEAIHSALLAHLLPADSMIEQAAFIFAKTAVTEGEIRFQCVECQLLHTGDFAQRAEDYLELTDETRARLIKRAHDLDASLVEFHSHPGPWPAAFSRADLSGFSQFVPHVWWRLKGKPYMAVVVAPSGFDALAWLKDARMPQALDHLNTGASNLRPTDITIRKLEKIDVYV